MDSLLREQIHYHAVAAVAVAVVAAAVVAVVIVATESHYRS